MTLFESDPVDGRVPVRKPSRWKTRATIFGVGLTIASAVGLLLTFVPSNPISDISAYSMSSDMADITDLMRLTNEGLDIFTDARPQLLAGSEFLDTCTGSPHGIGTDGLATVGCFIGGGYGSGQIAIFDPADERLVNQTVVTAAHEFLHAAYGRLDDNERDGLDTLLESRWSLVATDDPLQVSLASSVGSDEASRATEQFAYLGTSVADRFDPALEAVYSKYFEDRLSITDAYAADLALWDGLRADYEAAASAVTVQEQANVTEEAQIQAGRAQLTANQTDLNQLVEQFNARSAEEKATLFVAKPDGSAGEPYGSYLASLQPDYTARDVELTARQSALEMASTAAVEARAAVNDLSRELQELSAAATPSAR